MGVSINEIYKETCNAEFEIDEAMGEKEKKCESADTAPTGADKIAAAILTLILAKQPGFNGSRAVKSLFSDMLEVVKEQ